MRTLQILPLARLDLLLLWNHIAEESLDAANKVGDKLEEEIRDLLVLPGKGHTRPDARDASIRFWGVYSYIIAYRYDDEYLTLVRVVHGRRKLRSLFRKR